MAPFNISIMIGCKYHWQKPSRFSQSQDSLPYASLSMNKIFSQERKESIVSVKNIKPVSEFSVAYSPAKQKASLISENRFSFDEQATIT